MGMSAWKKSERQAPRLFDPYYDWAVATDFRYYGAAEWMPILLEMKHPADAVSFAGQIFKMRESGWAELVRISPLYQEKPRRLKESPHFLSAFVKREFIERLYAGSEPSDAIRRFQLGRATRFTAKANASFARRGPDFRLPPDAVVIGVIDDDIAFAHERFRDGPRSTRIHYFWDQMDPLAPSTTFYGREIFKHDVGATWGIDKRLANYRPGPLVDEEQLYRSYGYLDFDPLRHTAFARRAGHGTHVMDLAANPQARGIGPLIGVQLPSATTADTSGGTLSPQVVEALWYMLHRADDIAEASGVHRLPLVVNLSYGNLAGPHDTKGALERAIDEIIRQANLSYSKALRVVLPAGNAHLARCHANFDLAGKASQDLHWRVLPDDRTESFLEIWYPQDANLLVSVTSPTGSATLAFGVGVEYQWQPTAGVPAGLVSFYPPPPGSSRRLIRLSLAPTAWPDRALTLAPAGLWTVRVTNALDAPVAGIDAWIQRDDTAPGYPTRGRQSYFDHSNYGRFDQGGRAIDDDAHPMAGNSYVRRSGTLNAIATGRKTIVAGGFRRSDWRAAPYSASGPTVPPKRDLPFPDGPELMMVSDDTPSHHGVLAAGSRSGSCVAMHGTSVAAPQVTRWIAGDLMANNPGNRQRAGNAPTGPAPGGDYNEANPRPGTAVAQPPVERSGGGRYERASPRRPRFGR
jgi:hypothetical protein